MNDLALSSFADNYDQGNAGINQATSIYALSQSKIFDREAAIILDKVIQEFSQSVFVDLQA